MPKKKPAKKATTKNSKTHITFLSEPEQGAYSHLDGYYNVQLIDRPESLQIIGKPIKLKIKNVKTKLEVDMDENTVPLTMLWMPNKWWDD